MTLENADYKTFKNRMYCKSDFEDLFCRGCSKFVDDKVISATDGKLKGKWHFDCFNCQVLNCQFPFFLLLYQVTVFCTSRCVVNLSQIIDSMCLMIYRTVRDTTIK